MYSNYANIFLLDRDLRLLPPLTGYTVTFIVFNTLTRIALFMLYVHGYTTRTGQQKLALWN